jgi:hypothetical protein
MAADADARIIDPIGGPWAISVSIFTGWPGLKGAIDAALWAVDEAVSRGRPPASPLRD